MGIVLRNRSFLVLTALILGIGALIFAGVVAMRVAAAETATTEVPSAASANYASSYGLGNTTAVDAESAAAAAEAAPLTIEATDETPQFVKDALEANSPFVLLVYCDGAAVDEEMLSYFRTVQKRYSGSAEFFSFESLQTSQLGDTLDQAQVNATNPPVLAIVNGEGTVREVYTGWVGLKVLEQRVADIVNE